VRNSQQKPNVRCLKYVTNSTIAWQGKCEPLLSMCLLLLLLLHP